jgi:hypothetical protein
MPVLVPSRPLVGRTDPIVPQIGIGVCYSHGCGVISADPRPIRLPTTPYLGRVRYEGMPTSGLSQPIRYHASVKDVGIFEQTKEQ